MIPDAKRRRIDDQAIEEEDRISNLPRHLIDRILNSMLICDAASIARTSTLSKTWKNIWETYPYIILTRKYLYERLLPNEEAKEAAQARYLDIVNSILLTRKVPILKFSISIPHIIETPHLFQWIKQLPDKGVRELALRNSIKNLSNNIPSDFFSCSDLTKLFLVNIKLSPPHNFRGFCNLTTICLRLVIFTTDMSFGTQVKSLVLWGCVGIQHLDMQFANHGKDIKSLVIVRIVAVEILYGHAPDYDLFTDITKSFNLRRLLGNMPSLETLGLNGTSLEVPNIKSESDMKQYLESPDCVNKTMNRLRSVVIFNMMGSRAENLFIKFLLASSPSLRRMTLVRSKEGDPEEISRIEQAVSQFCRKSPVEIFWQ